MRWHRLLIALLAISAVSSCTEPPASAYRWEGIDAFALWPEDDPELAQEACARRPDEEEWRTTPETVAERFVRDVLGWKTPDIGDVDEREESPRTVVIAFDKSFPRHALGLVMHMRRLDDCWFVAVIQPREGEVVIDLAFSPRNGRPAVSVTVDGSGSQVVEIGYGGESERRVIKEGEPAVFYVENTDSVGHYITYPLEPSEYSQGYPLEPYNRSKEPQRNNPPG